MNGFIKEKKGFKIGRSIISPRHYVGLARHLLHMELGVLIGQPDSPFNIIWLLLSD
jgi:hypothetical protein